MGQKRNPVYDNAYQSYLDGFSLQQVAEQIGVTRQCVYKAFKKRHFVLRGPNFRPFQMYDGKKFTLRNSGYYSLTTDNRCLMQRYVWEKEKGIIPKGYDIHHLDEDRANNVIDNFECLPKPEHTSKYSPHNNQFGKGRRPVLATREDGIIKKWESSTIAINEIGGCTQGICNAINGRAKTYKGYRWEYATY